MLGWDSENIKASRIYRLAIKIYFSDLEKDFCLDAFNDFPNLIAISISNFRFICRCVDRDAAKNL